MILNVYKPKGWTSFDVVAKVRSVLHEKKVGHVGTLDPLAEGVLVVLTGEDTKRQSEFMKQDKEYEVKAAFGYESDSFDLGIPLRKTTDSQNNPELEYKLRTILPNYLGEINQTVPIYSAVKVKGKRLYALAHAGKELGETLPARKVSIHELVIKSFSQKEEILYSEGDKTLQISSPTAVFTVFCGSGTYIRSLLSDIGKELRVGAVVVELIRTRVGDYTSAEAITLVDFQKKYGGPKRIRTSDLFNVTEAL